MLNKSNLQLQQALDKALDHKRFRPLIARERLSVALVDIGERQTRFAAANPDTMLYAASLPKIAVMLGVFDQIHKGRLAYTPQLKQSLIGMIRSSSNREASNLIGLIGFETIAKGLTHPERAFYDVRRNGGLWVGKGYGGLGYWRRDPLHQISHGATARQVARFLVMMDRGVLVDSWISREMKTIMSHPAIEHKFVKGLARRPGSKIYRKSGTWKQWHADAALVERNGKKYVAVALMEGKDSALLADLIVKLDDLIHKPPPSADITE